MGWFFNSNSNKQNENQNSQRHSSDGYNNNLSPSKSSGSFYSKKRKCQDDPDDNKYLICKTVIKDDNGTKQEEERISKNSLFSRNSEQVSSFQSSQISSSYQKQSQQQKVFDKLASFFIQPSFFDFNNSTPHGITLDGQDRRNLQSQRFFKSFGKSRTCHTDPQDNEYMICKSRIQDGQQVKQVQERLKVSDQLHFPSLGRQLGGFGNQIDKEIHNLMHDINSGYNLIMPFIGPMMGFVNSLNSQNPDNNFSPADQTHFKPNFINQMEKQGQSDSERYFTSGNAKKDTNVYDL